MGTLALGIRVGRDFFVGGTQIVLEEYTRGWRGEDDHAVIRIMDKGQERKIGLTDTRMVEAFPQVFIGLGRKKVDPDDQEEQVRILVRAPKHIIVDRGSMHRKRMSNEWDETRDPSRRTNDIPKVG